MLKIIVHQAESVPNFERFTNVDPLVAVIFQGKSTSKIVRWRRDFTQERPNKRNGKDRRAIRNGKKYERTIGRISLLHALFRRSNFR